MAAVMTLGVAGCESFEDGDLTLEAPGVAPADGATLYDIEVCVATAEPAELDVVLRASAGEWALPDDPLRPADVQVRLDAETPCATERWIVPDDLRPVRFRALIGEATIATAETNLTPATVERVELSPSAPFLSTEGSSLLTVSARGRVASSGDTIGEPGPTVGTRVFLDVQSEPPNAAAVDDRELVLPNDATRTLQAAPGTELVSIVARDADGKALGSMTLTPPGGP